MCLLSQWDLSILANSTSEIMQKVSSFCVWPLKLTNEDKSVVFLWPIHAVACTAIHCLLWRECIPLAEHDMFGYSLVHH